MQTDLEQAQRRDLAAFNRMIAAHQAQIYTLSYRALGDEQAAVEAVQTAVGRARAEFGRHTVGKVQIWLLRKAVAACRERLRVPVATSDGPAVGANGAMEPRLQRGLCRLPMDLRLAVLLVDVAGLGYAEACEVLDASREQVIRWVAAARAQLIEEVSERPSLSR